MTTERGPDSEGASEGASEATSEAASEGASAGDESAAQSDRRRLTRLGLLLLFGALVFMLLRTWHARAVDVELIHRFPNGDENLPAEVEIQVWSEADLLADAYFPGPASITALEHAVRVPPGDYEVTFTIMHTYGEPELRFVRALHVEDAGRYYLDYE